MSFGQKALEKSACWLAIASYDREPASQNGSKSLGSIVRWFGLAKILRVPVGYQDETSFHYGEIPLKETTQAADMETGKISST